MRELILKMTMSLDGFVSATEGDNRWMFGEDPAAKGWSVDYLSQAGLPIMGGETFHAMEQVGKGDAVAGLREPAGLDLHRLVHTEDFLEHDDERTRALACGSDEVDAQIAFGHRYVAPAFV